MKTYNFPVVAMIDRGANLCFQCGKLVPPGSRYLLMCDACVEKNSTPNEPGEQNGFYDGEPTEIVHFS